MEHKRKNSAAADFRVIAIPMGPSVDEEHLFILNEQHQVHDVLDGRRHRGWFRQLVGLAAMPSRGEWEHYLHELQRYLQVINHYDRALADGLIPFRVVVKNVGPDTQKHIQIKATVQNGSIALTQKLPQRPARPVGPQHVAEPTTYNLLSGFMRRNIRLSPHSLRAEFSLLKPGDSADLVNETFFLDISPDTSMHYELTVGDGRALRGEIDL